MRRRSQWIITVIIVLTPIVAWADPIAISRPIGLTVGQFVPNTGEGLLTIRTFPGSAVLFDIPVTAADVGRTFQTDSTTNAEFDASAAILTNGRSDALELLFGPSSGGIPIAAQATIGTSERGWFNLPAGAFDFRGFTLTGVTFHVDDFFATPRPDLGDPFTLFSVVGSIGLLGSGGFDNTPVPEPGAFLLVVTGLVSVIARTRKRQKRAVRR
jgi:hypothetical protein